MTQAPLRTSEFTKQFASLLREIMSEAGVRQTAVAAHLGRAQAFVSERTSGKRPLDTDIIDAVAALSGRSPRELVVDIVTRMAADEADLPRIQSKAARPDRP